MSHQSAGGGGAVLAPYSWRGLPPCLDTKGILQTCALVGEGGTVGLGAGAAGRDLTPVGVSGGVSSTQGPEGRELACAVPALSKEGCL